MIANEDKFRVRRPSYQNWTTKESETVKAWDGMLKFISALDPKRIHGYRIQINWKREEEETVAGQKGGE